MTRPLNSRQTFACGTIKTTLLIEETAHPEALTAEAIDTAWAQFQKYVQKDVIDSAWMRIDGEPSKTDFSQVKQVVTYEIGTIKVTVTAKVTLRQAGLEFEINHDLASLMMHAHALPDIVDQFVQGELQKAQMPADPFDPASLFGEFMAGGMPVSLADLFSGRGVTILGMPVPHPRG